LVGSKRSGAVKFSYVGTIQCIPYMKCMFMPVLSDRRMVTACLELNEHMSSNISVFRVPTLQFLTNVQINQPTRCNNFSSLLLEVYVQINMFRASSRPSSGAQLQ